MEVKKFFRKILIAMTVCLSVASADTSTVPEDILGEWKYVGYIYDEIVYPTPNPGLFLTFTFLADNNVRLYWKRADEDYFCERSAKYIIDGDKLYQEVNWVNPGNHFTCGSDPDMQLGRKTENRFEIKENQLLLYLELSGKPFIYVLERIAKAPTTTEDSSSNSDAMPSTHSL